MYGDSTEDFSWTVWLFVLAQLFHGAGAAPLFTLGVTYIDENVSKKMSSIYLGEYLVAELVKELVLIGKVNLQWHGSHLQPINSAERKMKHLRNNQSAINSAKTKRTHLLPFERHTHTT